jgi:hypothetical protein
LAAAYAKKSRATALRNMPSLCASNFIDCKVGETRAQVAFAELLSKSIENLFEPKRLRDFAFAHCINDLIDQRKVGGVI